MSILETRHQAIATLTLNRPEAMNAITPEMLVSLGDALESILSDQDVRVVVLTGAGRAFSAGVDLKALGQVEIRNGAVGDILDLPARRVIHLIETMPQPVIAKINGHCYTGALELALACDLLVMAEGAGLGDTHAKWGLRPTWGMSQRLPRLIGYQKARELSFTARTVKAPEAKALGLVSEVLPTAELDDYVANLCNSMIENSGAAISAYKQLYHNTHGLSLGEGLAYEAESDYEIADSMQRLAGFLDRG